jgi:hypothetical protein
MTDISGFGSVIAIIASNTFPIGFPITNFADDADAFDFPSIAIADAAMGVNGDFISWAKAVPLKGTISVVVGSLSDQALQTIAKNNRPSQNKQNAGDIITMTEVLPDGTTATWTGGKMTEAPFGKSLSSAGRLKTRTYGFAFESVVGGL